jgi:hypothetical protein
MDDARVTVRELWEMTLWSSRDFGRRAFFTRNEELGTRGQEFSSAEIERCLVGMSFANVLSDREKRLALIDWWSALPVTTESGT